MSHPPNAMTWGSNRIAGRASTPGETASIAARQRAAASKVVRARQRSGGVGVFERILVICFIFMLPVERCLSVDCPESEL